MSEPLRIALAGLGTVGGRGGHRLSAGRTEDRARQPDQQHDERQAGHADLHALDCLRWFNDYALTHTFEIDLFWFLKFFYVPSKFNRLVFQRRNH